METALVEGARRSPYRLHAGVGLVHVLGDYKPRRGREPGDAQMASRIPNASARTSGGDVPALGARDEVYDHLDTSTS